LALLAQVRVGKVHVAAVHSVVRLRAAFAVHRGVEPTQPLQIRGRRLSARLPWRWPSAPCTGHGPARSGPVYQGVTPTQTLPLLPTAIPPVATGAHEFEGVALRWQRVLPVMVLYRRVTESIRRQR